MKCYHELGEFDRCCIRVFPLIFNNIIFRQIDDVSLFPGWHS